MYSPDSNNCFEFWIGGKCPGVYFYFLCVFKKGVKCGIFDLYLSPLLFCKFMVRFIIKDNHPLPIISFFFLRSEGLKMTEFFSSSSVVVFSTVLSFRVTFQLSWAITAEVIEK